jgi:hypothetical protein
LSAAMSSLVTNASLRILVVCAFGMMVAVAFENIVSWGIRIGAGGTVDFGLRNGALRDELLVNG